MKVLCSGKAPSSARTPEQALQSKERSLRVALSPLHLLLNKRKKKPRSCLIPQLSIPSILEILQGVAFGNVQRAGLWIVEALNWMWWSDWLWLFP